MSVKLRLSRGGAKRSPYYRIVAANSESRRDGRFLDHIGVYDPTTSPVTIRLKPERIRHWLSVGAQPTDTVQTILKKHLATAEDRVKTQALDGSSAVWVQGPANSPAAQGVKGGPAEANTRPKRTPRPSAAPAPIAPAAASPEPADDEAAEA